MIQTNLFGWGEDDTSVENTILCRHCSKVKPREAFRLYRRATGDRECRSTSCKECQKHNNRVVNSIRKTAPPMTDHCQCCLKSGTKLVLDHCYETETFRGWLCSHCNLSIGLLGDNIQGLNKAITYLSRLGWLSLCIADIPINYLLLKAPTWYNVGTYN